MRVAQAVAADVEVDQGLVAALNVGCQARSRPRIEVELCILELRLPIALPRLILWNMDDDGAEKCQH